MAPGAEDFTKMLNSFPKSIIADLVKLFDMESECASAHIVDLAYKNGVKDFTALLNKELLTKTLDEAGVKKAEDTKEMTSALMDSILKSGAEKFMNMLKADTLKEFVKVLDFETDAHTKEELAADVSDEILLLGCRVLFEKIPSATLKEMCSSLKLKSTTKKEELVDRILNVAFPGIIQEDETPPQKEEKPKGKEKASPKSKEKEKTTAKKETTTTTKKTKDPKEKKEKKEKKTKKQSKEEIVANRPALSKGITYDEVFQTYWTEEVKEFCKKNGIKTGKKGEMIKRILKFFENPEDKGFKEKKKRGKRSGPRVETKPKKKQRTNPSESSDDETMDTNGEKSEEKSEDNQKSEESTDSKPAESSKASSSSSDSTEPAKESQKEGTQESASSTSADSSEKTSQ